MVSLDLLVSQTIVYKGICESLIPTKRNYSSQLHSSVKDISFVIIVYSIRTLLTVNNDPKQLVLFFKRSAQYFGVNVYCILKI